MLRGEQSKSNMCLIKFPERHDEKLRERQCLKVKIFPKFMKDTNLRFEKHESTQKLNIQLALTKISKNRRLKIIKTIAGINEMENKFTL